MARLRKSFPFAVKSVFKVHPLPWKSEAGLRLLGLFSLNLGVEPLLTLNSEKTQEKMQENDHFC